MADTSSGPPTPQPNRTTVGEYEILRKIGQGGMATVFLARQGSTGRNVALKVLPPRLSKNEAFVARFLREAKLAARLNHPNIVHALEAGQAAPYYYYAMEFIDGWNLAGILKTSKLDEGRALEIARDVARALVCAHSTGLIHRDVKPGNILITADGTVKLADLGLARETGRQQDPVITQIGAMMGTPHYISPEQIRGDAEIDHRADIYSLGATLFHLLTGSPPYNKETGAEVVSMHLSAPVPDPRSVEGEVSESAAAIVRKAMAKNPDERYQTAKAMLNDIDRLLRGEVILGPSQPGQPARRPVVRIVCYIAAAVVILGVAGWIKIRSLSHPETPATSTETGSPAGSPPVDPPAADEELLASLGKWTKDHPGEYREAIRRYTDGIDKMTDFRTATRARTALEQLTERRTADADAAWQSVERRVDQLTLSNDYDAAIGALAAPFPEEFHELLSERARLKAERLRSDAESKFSAGVSAAEKFSQGGQPVEALAELDKLSQIKYEPRSSTMANLRTRIEEQLQNRPELKQKRQLAEATNAFAKLLADIRAAVNRGDLTRAAELGQQALKDETMRPLAKKVQRVANVTRLMPEIAEKRKAGPLNVLKGLQGKEVSLDTSQGTKSGIVKDVADGKITLTKAYSINGQKLQREEQVSIADLLASTRDKYKLDWQPETDEEAAAVAILASGEQATASRVATP